MMSPLSVDSRAIQSFLRTGPESSLHLQAKETGNVEQALRSKPVAPSSPADPHIMDQLGQWEHFSALAVHVDPPADIKEDEALHAVLNQSLQMLAGDFGSIWFRWTQALYVCLLPDADDAHALAAAHRIQTELALQRVESVSIGIARFPLIDFDRAACLQNACKALDHAAFFGAGSIVRFDALSLNISGDYAYQDGRLDDAIANYQAALRLDAANVNVLNSLGICLAQKGDTTAARALFEEAHRTDPQETMAIYNLGVLHLLAQERPEALAAFRQAYAATNEIFDIPFQIGKILTEQKDYAQAEPYLQAALALNAASAPAQALLGQCLSACARAREAIAAYKKAVKINPNDAGSLSALGTLYDAKGENIEICLAFCRQSVALAPENGPFRMELARMYAKNNQLDLALAEYETAALLGQKADRQISEIQGRLAENDGRKKCCA